MSEFKKGDKVVCTHLKDINTLTVQLEKIYIVEATFGCFVRIQNKYEDHYSDVHQRHLAKVSDFQRDLKGVPNDIIRFILSYQVRQGHKENVDVFDECITEGARGFEWEATVEGWDFWNNVLTHRSWKTFYDRYPKATLAEFPFKTLIEAQLKQSYPTTISESYPAPLPEKWCIRGDIGLSSFITSGHWLHKICKVGNLDFWKSCVYYINDARELIILEAAGRVPVEYTEVTKEQVIAHFNNQSTKPKTDEKSRTIINREEPSRGSRISSKTRPIAITSRLVGNSKTARTRRARVVECKISSSIICV